jgi:PhnB protein
MTAPIPPGHEGIIPHLVVGNGAEAIAFYKIAFGAEELCRMPSPDGAKIMHAEIKIGNSVVYLCDDFPEYCDGKSRTPASLGTTPVTIHQYVEDCDAAIAKAEKAGAVLSMPAVDQPWGDRYGQVTDPYGHVWSFGTHVKDMTMEEIQEACVAAFS